MSKFTQRIGRQVMLQVEDKLVSPCSNCKQNDICEDKVCVLTQALTRLSYIEERELKDELVAYTVNHYNGMVEPIDVTDDLIWSFGELNRDIFVDYDKAVEVAIASRRNSDGK